jgi:hypothetical protein
VKAWLKADPALAARLSMPANASVSQYVDTSGNSVALTFDLANLGSISSSSYKYASNEIAVARVLWKMNESLGAGAIWRTMSSRRFIDATTPANLELFWDSYLAVTLPNSTTRIAAENILSEREIYYIEDSDEPDDTTDQATQVIPGIGAGRRHLYRADGVGDTDYFKFEATATTSYTVAADNLINGADTYLQVLNAQGVPLVIAGKAVESDDFYVENSAIYPLATYGYERYDSLCGDLRAYNDTKSLHAKVSFTAPSSGTYYVKVRTTIDNAPYLSAGRYGSYNFSVSVQ